MVMFWVSSPTPSFRPWKRQNQTNLQCLAWMLTSSVHPVSVSRARQWTNCKALSTLATTIVSPVWTGLNKSSRVVSRWWYLGIHTGHSAPCSAATCRSIRLPRGRVTTLLTRLLAPSENISKPICFHCHFRAQNNTLYWLCKAPSY